MENKSYLDKLDLKLNCHKQSDKSDFHRGALPLNFHCLYHLCCTTFLYPHLLFHFIACSKIALAPKLVLFLIIPCSETVIVPKLPLFLNPYGLVCNSNYKFREIMKFRIFAKS